MIIFIRKIIWGVNWSRPSNSCMHQLTMPSLVQIMTCCQFGAKPLSEPMLVYYCFMDPCNKFQWILNQNTVILIQESNFKNVICKMAAILPQCINPHSSYVYIQEICLPGNLNKENLQYTFVWIFVYKIEAQNTIFLMNPRVNGTVILLLYKVAMLLSTRRWHLPWHSPY